MSNVQSTYAGANSPLAKGLDVRFLLAGLGFLVGGAFVAYLGIFTSVLVTVRRIPIPLSIVGPLAALFGMVILAMSFRQLKCVTCNRPLEMSSAWFPPEYASQVQQALAAGDVSRLQAIPMGNAATSHVQVNFEHCEGCRAVAKVDVDSFTPSRASLMVGHVLVGPRVAPLSAFLKERSESHEERYGS